MLSAGTPELPLWAWPNGILAPPGRQRSTEKGRHPRRPQRRQNEHTHCSLAHNHHCRTDHLRRRETTMRPWPLIRDGQPDRRYRCWPENLHGKWRYHLLFNGHVVATEHSWSALQATAEEHAACLARHPAGKAINVSSAT